MHADPHREVGRLGVGHRILDDIGQAGDGSTPRRGEVDARAQEQDSQDVVTGCRHHPTVRLGELAPGHPAELVGGERRPAEGEGDPVVAGGPTVLTMTDRGDSHQVRRRAVVRVGDRPTVPGSVGPLPLVRDPRGDHPDRGRRGRRRTRAEPCARCCPRRGLQRGFSGPGSAVRRPGRRDAGGRAGSAGRPARPVPTSPDSGCGPSTSCGHGGPRCGPHGGPGAAGSCGRGSRCDAGFHAGAGDGVDEHGR